MQSFVSLVWLILNFLSVPDFANGAGDSNILSFHLVDAKESSGSACVQQVNGCRVEFAIDTLRNVIDDTGLKAQMAVHENQRSERSVQDGRKRAADKRRHHQRHHANDNETLERPVVRAVGCVGGGDCDCVVDCAHDSTRGLRNCAEWLSANKGWQGSGGRFGKQGSGQRGSHGSQQGWLLLEKG